MMNREESLEKLKRASPSKLSKRFVASFIDLIIVVFLSFTIFSFIFGVVSNSTSYKNIENNVQVEVDNYKEYTSKARIVEYSDGNRLDGEELSKKNLYRAICLSYEIFGNEQRPEFIIEENHIVTTYGIGTIENDNIGYFYNQYLVSTDFNYNGKDPILYLYDVYITSFDENVNFMFTFDKNVSNMPVLNTQVAYYIFHYLFINQDDTIGQTGLSYYQSYINGYVNMLSEAENILIDLEPYHSSHYIVWQEAYISQARYVNVCLIVSIICGTIIGIILPKFLFKYERTVGYIICGLGVLDLDNNPNHWGVTLIKGIYECFVYLTSGIVLYLFSPFNGVFDGMFLPFKLNGNFSFGLLILIAGLVLLVVNIVGLFTHYRQNLINLAFKDKVVDIHYLDEGDRDEINEGRPY